MQKNWKQLLLALFMGIVLPSAALKFAVALAEGETKEQTGPISIPQGETRASEPAGEQQTMIPVLQGDTVGMMELENYIFGVVLAEMPASFEVEALKAQAVVARTVTLRCTQLGNRHEGGAICTDSKCCQAYMSEADYRGAGGTEENVEKIRGAVEATAGQVLTYEGELIEATYFSCSGGWTEDAQAVWGSDVPYLQAVESPGEEWADAYTATVTFSASEFQSLLGRTLTGTPASWLGSIVYTEGGGVATMVIAGKTYKGTELRSLLGLNSTAFTMTAEGETITVTTSGRGHRVGMSQYGADAMALTGSSYEEILAYYYQGTRIDKMSAVG